MRILNDVVIEKYEHANDVFIFLNCFMRTRLSHGRSRRSCVMLLHKISKSDSKPLTHMTENSSQSSVAEALVKVQNLSKKYGSKRVLTEVDLNINPGEIVGLIGPNGAGKSTLLKALMGLISYSGEVSIFGQTPYKNRDRLLEKMSYVADVASLPNWMKIGELLSFVRQTHPKFDYDKAMRLLAETDMLAQQKIASLSKGMKTRLHLIVILSIETDLMILDEPTLGLDVLVRRDFQDRLLQDYFQTIATPQRSILITTHQIDEVESILTRVLFIKEGRITLDVKKTELQQRYSKLITTQNVVFSENTARLSPQA